jgi:hypothetical protein
MPQLTFWRCRPPGPVQPPAPESPEPSHKSIDIRKSALGVIGVPLPRMHAFTLPQAAPGVIEQDVKLVCDAAVSEPYLWALQGAFAEGLGFLGYPYLAELTQRPEYRRPAEILAKEVTRKWIRLQGAGDTDRSAKLAAIEAETDSILVNKANSIVPAESRKRLAGQEDGPYAAVDLNATLPERPLEEEKVDPGCVELKWQ